MNKVSFILGLALLVIIVLYWRSCHLSPSPLPTKSDSAVAAIVEKVKSDTAAVHHFADSVNLENIVLKTQRDSLLNVLNVTKGSLRGKDKDIQSLIDNINRSEAGNDQTAALASCDSLKEAYPIAKGLVTQYINTNDSLKKATNLLLANKDTVLARLIISYNQATNELFETSRMYGNVSESYKKALKQSGKKWGIGPGIGASVINGKLAPVINFSIHYDLIKF